MCGTVFAAGTQDTDDWADNDTIVRTGQSEVFFTYTGPDGVEVNLYDVGINEDGSDVVIGPINPTETKRWITNDGTHTVKVEAKTASTESESSETTPDPVVKSIKLNLSKNNMQVQLQISLSNGKPVITNFSISSTSQTRTQRRFSSREYQWIFPGIEETMLPEPYPVDYYKQLGAANYEDYLIYTWLGQTSNAANAQTELNKILTEGKLTRTTVENYYKSNLQKVLNAIIKEEIGDNVPSGMLSLIQTAVYNFALVPSNSTYNKLKSIYIANFNLNVIYAHRKAMLTMQGIVNTQATAKELGNTSLANAVPDAEEKLAEYKSEFEQYRSMLNDYCSTYHFSEDEGADVNWSSSTTNILRTLERINDSLSEKLEQEIASN
jgi:hypothetical protein